MATIIRSSNVAKRVCFLHNRLVDLTSQRYVSHNRVKRIKKPEITDREANLAKSAAMRAEIDQHGALYEGRRFESIAQSISTRGYLRAIKPYNPPVNVGEQVHSIAKTNGITDPTQPFTNKEEKFAFLSACSDVFGHDVPNSILHEVRTVEDALIFYQTPIDTRLPLDAIKSMELPQNLHIQHEHIRFNPETDTMFSGKSAFPKSSTVVTGIKYKRRYPGHEAKKSWP